MPPYVDEPEIYTAVREAIFFQADAKNAWRDASDMQMRAAVRDADQRRRAREIIDQFKAGAASCGMRDYPVAYFVRAIAGAG